MNNSLSTAVRDGSAYELASKQLDQVSGGSSDLAIRSVTYTAPIDTSASLVRDYSGGRFTPVRSQSDSW
jgi:hypothetical protein